MTNVNEAATSRTTDAEHYDEDPFRNVRIERPTPPPPRSAPSNANRGEIIAAMNSVVDKARDQIAFYEALIANVERAILTIEGHG